jgi:hypothetical protein
MTPFTYKFDEKSGTKLEREKIEKMITNLLICLTSVYEQISNKIRIFNFFKKNFQAFILFSYFKQIFSELNCQFIDKYFIWNTNFIFVLFLIAIFK